MADFLMAALDLLSICGWILIGISGMVLKDIMKEVKYEHYILRWKLMYLILPLLLLYPSFLFYQYIYGDIPLSKGIVTVLIVFLAIGSLLLLYLAHQIRSMQLRKEISGVAASVLVIYLGLSVYLSFQLTDFGEVLNNLLFSTAIFMLSLAMIYLGNYALEFSKVVRVSPTLYAGGVFVLIPGIMRAVITEPQAFGLHPYLTVLKIVGTLGIIVGGFFMFVSADQFKRRVLEFDIKLK
ncbi:MAG: hypothetical protein ABIG96_00700 [Candidatus Micrarchaeota archaeon]